jgi:sRNA-binding protein
MPWWDKGLKSVKDGAEKVSFEAQKLVRVQREEAVVTDLNNKIQGKTMDVGRLALQLQRTGALNEPAVAALAQEISAMEAQIQAQQEKIVAIKAEQWQPGEEAAPAATPAAAPQPEPAVVTPVTAEPPGVSAVAPVVPPTEAEAEAPAPAADTIRCPNCQTEVRSTAAFCPECGTKLK